VTGKDDHRDSGRDRFGLEFPQDVVSREVGQVEIEEDDVGDVPDGRVEAGPAGPDGAQRRSAG
jgi:hypothetical protein